MTKWTSTELEKIGTTEELQIASLRQAGTLRNSGRSAVRVAMTSMFDP
jgi:hypothetical protein